MSDGTEVIDEFIQTAEGLGFPDTLRIEVDDVRPGAIHLGDGKRGWPIDVRIGPEKPGGQTRAVLVRDSRRYRWVLWLR